MKELDSTHEIGYVYFWDSCRCNVETFLSESLFLFNIPAVLQRAPGDPYHGTLLRKPTNAAQVTDQALGPTQASIPCTQALDPKIP